MRIFSQKKILWLTPLIVLALAIAAPIPARFLERSTEPSTRILDRNGRELYEIRHPVRGSQQWVALTDIPESCVSGILAIEDRGFYSHAGLSLNGIARALWQNLSSGHVVSGGSTITQQVARLTLGSPSISLRASRSRTLGTKMLEALLALKLEQSLTKDEILERYLNTASFGHQATGIEAAADTYFGKTPRELSVAECALLTGLPQSPSALDPFAHFSDAKERQNRVLTAMEETNALSRAEAEEARAEPLTLTEDRFSIRAPHFVMWLMGERPGDLHSPSVRTTLDLDLQTKVERIVERKLSDLADQNVTSAAVVVLDAHTGDVLSLVGSADYFDQEHDGAVNVALASRQPGSALKPFTYALALSQGDTGTVGRDRRATAATTVADVQAQFFTQEGNPYTPRNYDYLEHGLIRYREALANSYNIAAVKVAERVGVGRLLGFLRSAGLSTLTETPEHYGLALTLGDGEVKLLELTQAYGIFPRGGETLPIRTLSSDPIRRGTDILDPKVAWLISDILSDPTARLAEFGESGPLSFDFPVAAKTGTTRNSRDNWTIGFTPDVLVGVWVGNADNTPMRDTSGVTGAGPIFHDVMLTAVKNLPPKDFSRPNGLTEATICALSGKLPTEFCPHTIDEWFIAGTEPKESDDLYRPFLIDTRNGLLANNNCVQTFVQQKAFAVFPKEVEKWARENGWPTPPTRLSPLCEERGDRSSVPSASSASSLHQSSADASDDAGQAVSSWIEITRPQNGDSFALDPMIPDAAETIIFEAHASSDIETIDWYVDGKKVGTDKAPDFRFTWKPHVGTFSVKAQAGTTFEQRTFEVVK